MHPRIHIHDSTNNINTSYDAEVKWIIPDSATYIRKPIKTTSYIPNRHLETHLNSTFWKHTYIFSQSQASKPV